MILSSDLTNLPLSWPVSACRQLGYRSTHFLDCHNPWYVDINYLEVVINGPINIPLRNISLQAQSQRLTVQDCADTHKPGVMQILLAAHGIWTIVEVGRIMENHQERMSIHKAWALRQSE